MAARRLALAASVAALVAAHTSSPAGEEDQPQTGPTTRPSFFSATEAAVDGGQAEPLRGSGYLILDHRDTQEQVKAQLRKFVQEVRSSVPPEFSREETRYQVDAFLDSDLSAAEQLPHLALEFTPEVTRHNLITYLENTPSARASRQICPLSCPVEAMFRKGFHIHLTRPAGGPGDSVLALEFHGQDERKEHGRSQASAGQEAAPRESLLDRYPLAEDGRKPIGQAFGVRVYLGEPVIPESSQLPPE